MNDTRSALSSTDKEKKKTTMVFAVVLFVLLGLIYTLIYSGTFTTDDEHILASQTLSFAFDPHFNIDRVLGNTRVFYLSQLSSRQVMEAANIEPALSWFGVLMAKLSILFGIGHVQILFLLNIWITAFTGMVIFITSQDMSYQRWTGLILAGLYGLGTIALPYSKTYFRDPLAALLLLRAWMFAYRIRAVSNETGMKKARLFSWLGFVLSSIAGVLAKNTVVIAIPVLLIIILGRKSSGQKEKNPGKRRTIGIVAGCCLAVLLMIWFLVVPRIPSLARFTPQYYKNLIQFFLSSFHPNLIQALIGPFISPGKSIFLFSPILLLSLASLVLHFKKTWQAWFFLLLLIIFQALFYDVDWAGHVNWGLRFTLPAIPILILSAAPIVEMLLKSSMGKVLIGVIAVLSISVQCLGALVPVRQYFVEKAIAIPPVSETALTWQSSQSILLWSAQRVFDGNVPDLAIWRNPIGLLVILAGSLAIGVMILFALLKNKRCWLMGVAVGSLILINLGLVGLYMYDPNYYKTRDDLVYSQQYLVDNIANGDIVLIKSYGAPDWIFWMNWGSLKIHWVCLPYSLPTPTQMIRFNQSGQPEDALDPISLAILGKEALPGKRLWIVIADDSPGAGLGLEQKWLEQKSSASECDTFDGSSHITLICDYQIKQ